MFTADCNLGIIFNGEIYNHVMLRRQLEAREYFHRSTSRTAALLHKYAALPFGTRHASLATLETLPVFSPANSRLAPSSRRPLSAAKNFHCRPAEARGPSEKPLQRCPTH